MSSESLLEKIVGKGRLAEVYKGEDSQGNPIARKIFTGSLITKLANYFFSGAPNSYIWSEDAVHAAYYRRNILSELVESWFDTKLRVAKARGFRWNDTFKAYELQTEFIDGRHASLHHPFSQHSQQREAELSDFVNNIMKPLQERLIEAGFDGLVWQAGKGIPNASSNFMLENNILENNSDGKNRLVWVDLESAVPAMLPLNLLTLFSFYLPMSIKHRTPLFDDIDIDKLLDYINAHERDLESKIGSGRFNILLYNINKLEGHQNRWKSMRRVDRSITYSLKKERINQQEADWYFKHPYIWYGKEIGRISWEAANKLVVELPTDIYNKLISINYKKILSNAWKFISSEEYRMEVARNYISGRIDQWESRKQLKKDEADYLHDKLKSEATSPYLTDLIVHGNLKVFDWVVLPTVLSTLYAYDIIDYKEALALGLWGGSITRTAYTVSRMAFSMMKPSKLKKIPSNIKQYIKDISYIGHSEGSKQAVRYAIGKVLQTERFIALGVGTIPQLGNAAYPVQMIYSGSTVDREIGKLMTYHILARIGEAIPLYGGRDTRTEHFFNHIGDIIVKNRRALDSR